MAVSSLLSGIIRLMEVPGQQYGKAPAHGLERMPDVEREHLHAGDVLNGSEVRYPAQTMKHTNMFSFCFSIAATAFLLIAMRPAHAQAPATGSSELAGVWSCRLMRADGEMPLALALTQTGDRVTGRVSSPESKLKFAALSLTNDLISIQLASPNGTYTLTAKSTGQKWIDGRVMLDGKPAGTWRGERAAPPGGKDGIESLADGKVRPASVGALREAYLPIAFPSSHSANLLALRNGDLICVWFSGLWEGDSNVAIVMSRLRKGSGQWTPPEVVAQKLGYSLQNPVAFEAPSGALWVFYTAQAGNAGQANAQIFAVTSTDAGQHWTEPKLLFAQPGSFDRQRLLVVGGTWLFPMYYTPSSGITGDAALRNYSAVQISADEGRTWKECTVPSSEGLVQPDVIEVAPSHFVAFFRSRWADWVYTSTSADGCSWTKPAATQLPNNNASIQVVRLNNGHLVMAFNNRQASGTRTRSTTAPRWPLSVALSTDGGRTWTWGVMSRPEAKCPSRLCPTWWQGPVSKKKNALSSTTSILTNTLPSFKLPTTSFTWRTLFAAEPSSTSA